MDKDQESLIQQDFEDWVVREFPFSITDTTFHKLFDENFKLISYKVHEINRLWQGWKAAHNKYQQDVVVEIPYSWEAYEAGCTVVDLELLLEALNDAGVKYK